MSVPYRFFCFVLIIFTSIGLFGQIRQLPTTPVELSSGGAEQAFVSGQVLIKLSDNMRPFCQENGIDDASLNQWLHVLLPSGIRQNFKFPQLAYKQLPTYKQGLDLIYELRFGADWPMGKVVEHLERHPSIIYAEPRYIYEFFYQPNDPLADTTGGIANQWYLAQVMAREAWDINRGDSSVVIGITDSGISFLHPDLKKNLGVNQNDPIDGIDNDHDGYIDNYRGWDFAGARANGIGDNDPSYLSKHGVSVTGISSATPDNRVGSAGAAFNCLYLPIKAAPDNRPGAITHGYESVLYAALQGAKVINCSWGGRVKSQVGQDVIDYVIEVTQSGVVAACGNAPANIRFYPAAFANVLSVTNLHFGDTVCCPEGLGLGTTYNYTVDVGAPGWKLSGPTGNSNYEGFSGTSAASPLASAVVGITCAHFPNYTGFQAAQRVRVTTDDHYHIDFNRQFLHQLGTGRVNMYRALTDPLKPSIRNLDFQLVNQRGEALLLPGDTAYISGNFINYLDPSTADLRLQLELPKAEQNQYVEWLDDTKVQGIVNMNEAFDLGTFRFAFRLSPLAPTDLPLDLRLVFTDTALRYQDFQYIHWLANPTIVDLTVNDLHTSMNSTGNFGYQDYPRNEIGLGVQFRSNERSALFEGGLLIGRGPDQVSANLRDNSGIKQQDFIPIQAARLLDNPLVADQEAEAVFHDLGSSNPLGVSVVQHSYAWSDPFGEDYVIFDFTIHNDSAAPLTDLYVGLMANWDLSDSTRNTSYFNAGFKLAYALDQIGNDPALYGISVLSQGDLKAYADDVPTSDFSDRGYFRALSNANAGLTTAGTAGQGANIWHLLGEGPFDILPNSSYRVGFAVLAAGSINDLFINRNLAAETYRCYVLGEGPTAGFAFYPDTAGINQHVVFSDLNQNATSWNWDFGDGTNSTVKNPSHTYQQVGTYTVSLTVNDGNCVVKSKKQIRIDYRQTALAPSFEDAFSIYPNPSQDIFWLEPNKDVTQSIDIRVFDLTGRLAWEKKNDRLSAGQPTAIELTQLPDGVYLLEVLTEKGKMYTKLKKLSK